PGAGGVGGGGGRGRINGGGGDGGGNGHGRMLPAGHILGPGVEMARPPVYVRRGLDRGRSSRSREAVMRRALPIAAILAAIAILVLAPSVGAFTLNGCTMVVQSSGPDGSALDAASGPGAAGTEADPLIVDWNGT